MIATVTVRGDLDQPRVADFRAEVQRALSAAPAELVLDLADVAFVDSSGLGALVAVRNACRTAGCRLTLSNVPDQLAERMDITGLTDLFRTG